MNLKACRCGALALYRTLASGKYFVGRYRCKSSLKCPACARQRARAAVQAITALHGERVAQGEKCTLAFATVTLAPSLFRRDPRMRDVRYARRAVLSRARRAFVRFTYICTPERGEHGGRLHFHFILVTPSARFARRVLRRAVRGSYVSVRVLRDAQAAAQYLSKYVSKQRMRLTLSRDVARAMQAREKERCELVAVQNPDETDAQFLEWADRYVSP